VGSMSGGEKARLVLCMIVWQRPNLLLLDEPTNHLDLATREALGMALNEFEGTVMLVSHDRALLRSVCDEFWMVSRGGVSPFDGDLDDYQRYLLDEAKRQRELAKKGNADASRHLGGGNTSFAKAKGSKPAPSTNALRNEVDRIDARMKLLNQEGASLESHMNGAIQPVEIGELGKRLKSVNEELRQLEDRWLELSDQLEASTT
jgi:ATP-binding cassette subfamily F protein 3